MRYLWAGVGAGIGLALALAAVMLGIARLLSDEGLEYFQLAMMLVASGLIVQMVFWMRRHGRTMKRDLETEHAEQCRNRQLVGSARRRRAGGRPRERRNGRVPVRPRRPVHERVELPRHPRARDRRRVAHVLGAAAGQPVLFVADILSRQRDPALAAGRRAPRLRRRQIDRARRAAAARRPALGYLRGDRRLEPRGRPPRRFHRLSRASGAVAAARAGRVLGDGRHAAAATPR